MKRKAIISLLLVLALVGTPVSALAAGTQELPRNFACEQPMAFSLNALGLLQGVAEGQFALERVPSRAEALVMLLRLLGKEDEALASDCSHPFTDVATLPWAEPYIAYAYEHDLVKGVTETAFGGGEPADVRTCLTFVLRALGYSDGEDGDFSWADPAPLARTLGLLPPQVQTAPFLRADMVSVCYAALSAPCKDGSGTLAAALTEAGVLDPAALERFYDPAAAESGILGQPAADNVNARMYAALCSGGIDITGLPYYNYGGVSLIGDAGYELYGFYAGGMERCAQQVRNAAEALPEGCRMFGIVVPNRLGAVLQPKDFSYICPYTRNETDAIAYSYSVMGDGVHTVDAISELRSHNQEYIYFRTDHHWTALGAYYAYSAWARSAGVQPVNLANFRRLDMTGHLGLFYSMCSSPYVMRSNPDTVSAFFPNGNFEVTVQEAGGGTHAGQLVYDYSNGGGYSYGSFLGGDHPLTTIVNKDIEDDSACVLVKDSYGNPFAVYLAQHYRTVYVIDYRYYKNVPGYLSLSQFAAQKGAKDFIVLLPMTLSQSDGTAGLLRNYCR